MYKNRSVMLTSILWVGTIFILLFISCLLGSCQISDQPEILYEKEALTWEKINQAKVSHSVYYGGFYDPMHGATVGYHGTTYTTNDGGKTWNKGVNEANCRYGLDWFDMNYLWTVGNYGGNRVSINGGRSLFAVTDLPLIDEIPNNQVDIVSQQLVWVGAPNQLAVSKDAGFTFSNVIFPENFNGLAAISFQSELSGYIMDFSGALFQTQDGGVSWSTFGSLPISCSVMHDETPTATMRFDTQRNGKVVIRGSDRKLYAFMTDDQGQTFTTLSFSSEERGLPYLSKDAITLTLTDYLGVITIYQLK